MNVLEPEQHERAHIPRAINIPEPEIAGGLRIWQEAGHAVEGTEAA